MFIDQYPNYRTFRHHKIEGHIRNQYWLNAMSSAFMKFSQYLLVLGVTLYSVVAKFR